MKVKDHFMDIFGEFEMTAGDIGELVFRAGWNAAVDELTTRAGELPFGKDTQDSFAVWAKEIKE
jgi:hypothetical protein